ncbi:MAG: outer membrane protein transport protein [Deltaproteobacteria bacterium]|nr:outer membrane protein transport protein [Deltaproteobacteria bacterium]
MKTSYLWPTLLFSTFTGTAAAGGLAVGEQNAVSAGTGGAGAARDGDPGAAWHVPAALADDGGWRVGISLALARPSLEARATDGSWSTENESAWSTPPHIDASYAQGRWAAGISLGVPFGGGVQWPAMWPGATQSVRTQLMVLRAAPFAAWSFGKLRVSAGVHFDRGRLQIQRNLDFIDTQGDVRLDLAGNGMGVDAALYWQARRDLGVGLVYRGRSTLDFHGNANFTAPDAFASKTPDQTASTSMTMPDVVVLGAQYTRGAYAAVLDLEWSNWSLNRRTTVNFTNASTPQAVQENQWHDTVALRAGGEWTRDKLVVRGGGYYDPSPVPAAHLTPSSPDASRVGLTAGASYRIAPAWSADLFAERMWLLRRETTSTDTMSATYGGTAIVLGAGVRWTPAR